MIYVVQKWYIYIYIYIYIYHKEFIRINKLILKPLYTFRSEKHIIFAKKIIKCHGENTEKRKKVSVSIINKVTKIDEHGNKRVVTIYYKIKFIYGTRFMTTSFSSLFDNLTVGVNKIKCKD